ncbi:MAG: TVP38/TMEM64 family protein [Nitrospira sp. CR1.1]|jgi:uncharacterized membrane protein YdjX (TVP38/TMEM64 family)|nr:TVP38/TMEM64 family protein [Nitrospira sp. CR1.1]
MNTSVDSCPAKARVGGGRLLLGILVACAVAGFVYFDLGRYLSLEALKANRDQLLAFTEANYSTAVAMYVLAYCTVVGLSLPGGAIMTLAGGFLFGSMLGTLYVNVGATVGATLAFLVARYLLRDWVEQQFGSRLGAIQDGFARNAFSYLLTLRLIPLFPFFLVNMVSGLTRVNVGTYVAATSLGIIPGSFVFAYAGRQLGTINSLKEIVSPNVLTAFTLLGLLALVPILYKRFTGTSN